MTDDAFTNEHLIPVGEADLSLTGTVILEDSAGEQSFAEVSAPIARSFSAARRVW